MKATLSTGNRITLPKSIVEELNLNQGDSLDISVVDNTIVLKRLEQTNETKVSENDKDGRQGKIKIVSNLEEGKNFKRKCYSDCGLVIRTKKKYLEKFCSICQGKLVQESNEQLCCPYYKLKNKTTEMKRTTKELCKSINESADKVKKLLDKEIDKVSKEDIKPEVLKFNRNPETTILPVHLRLPRICEKCEASVEKGFIIDEDEFYCKKCASEDFIDYIKGGK